MAAVREDEALLEAAAVLLRAAGGHLFITSLNKALFYLDLKALRDEGKTITGAAYIALKAGPVVAKYQTRLVNRLESLGIAQQDDEDGAKPVCLVEMPDLTELSDQEVEMAERIGRWAAGRQPTELSDLSHENIGWKMAWDAGMGAGRAARPVNMRIAMQQVLDIDPWLQAEPDRDFRLAVDTADSATGVPW